MDKAISEFLDERKDAWLKKKIKMGMSDQEKVDLEREANQVYDIENWLPDAAKRACQLSMVSHPSKFSHPSSKTSAVVFEPQSKVDGYLATGCIEHNLDVFGNAAAMDVYKFLSLKLDDEKTVLSHLEENTEISKKNLSLKNKSYDEIRKGLLSIKDSGNSEMVTSGLVKQVYFPVSNEYHLLSVLTPSGLLFKMRQRIQNMRFGEVVKEAREKRRKNELSRKGFDDVLNLTMIGYGGTKPQNISVLNSQAGGKAYVLPSMPPGLSFRKEKLPTTNFFVNCLWPDYFKENFMALHKLLAADVNNIKIRRSRDLILENVFETIVGKIWSIRGVDEGWSSRDRFEKLPHYQKIMLDSALREERENTGEWLDQFIKEVSRWMITAYKKVMGKKPLALNDDELRHIHQLIAKQKEVLL